MSEQLAYTVKKKENRNIILLNTEQEREVVKMSN